MKSKFKPHPGGQNRTQPVFTATYADHPLPRYNKNPLIRALTPLPNVRTLQKALTTLPPYSEDERHLDRASKNALLAQLFHIYIGLPRVVELMEAMHTLICDGYVGRVPNSLEDHAHRQEMYEKQQRGEFFKIENGQNGAEFCAALIGIPGIGKSKAIERASAPYRRVIYHPELNIWQIPALLVEMPYKGVSINVLAHSIIRALDEAYPEGNYYETYLHGKPNAEVLFMDACLLMRNHYVGLLLVDESQNKDYQKGSRKPSGAVEGQAPLATLLTTATNRSRVPMLMCGTPELRDVMGVRMSMLRRTVGRGMQLWKPLSLPRDGKRGGSKTGEFDVVLKMLERYQWTKTPFKFTDGMRNLFYHYTQGISDFIIKLYHDVQLRAIRNGGDEVVDEELVHEVANDELAAITEVTRALRKQDFDRTGRMADLAAYLEIDPLGLSFDRKPVEEALFPSADEEPEAPEPEAKPFEQPAKPKEMPLGASAKRTRTRKPKVASGAKSPAPFVQPVDDLTSALDS